MTKGELFRRYLVFFVSLIFNGCGVAMIAAAGLGTSPISSAWYEISLHIPLTFGTVTMLGNLVLIISQYFMLGDQKKDKLALFRLVQQIPSTLIFSVTIDVCMHLLGPVITAYDFYLYHLGILLFGNVILACGISMAVRANVAFVAGEAFVKALCVFLNKEFGLVKLCFDVSLVLLAVVVGLAATHFSAVASVREGTVIGALMVGPLVRIFSPHLVFLDKFFGTKAAAAPVPEQDWQWVITISREYGCGARQLGKMLAEKLGFEFYDSQIISMIARETGFSEEYVARHESRIDNAMIYEMLMQDYTSPVDKSLSKQDALYTAAANVITKLARQKPCVIVGRLSEQILKENPKLVKLRLYAPYEDKLKRCMEDYHLSKEQAQKNMELFDKRRAEHFAHYVGGDVAEPHHYDAVLNSGVLGIETCCKIAQTLYQTKMQHFKAQKAA